MSEPEIPNFGALLAPYISQVPDGSRPRFLALLERGAAARYRSWAAELPEHADVLLACSASEDEIADRIESVFPVQPAVLAELEALLPGARDTYYDVFAGMPVWDQLRVQAGAELQGAAAWQSIATGTTDPAVLEQLNACSALEEESSRRLGELIAAHAAAH